jgi:hydantoinase/carbamoylase family amidase
MKNMLKENLIDVGKYGRDPERIVTCYEDLDSERGVTRPTGTIANKKLRDYAIARMKEIGLEVRIDKIGNIFAKKEGYVSGKKSVMCGSHLDSVINGGQFDGTLGVFAAIEALRRLKETEFKNDRPIEIVVFTGEEGSAFGLTLLGSTVLTGKLSLEEALKIKNKEGETLSEVLEQIGYLGNFIRKLDDVDYFIEMHIEQGPVLYNKKIPIGIVENIAGIAWIYVTITGEGNHAGTTPMNMRKDALVAASNIVQFVNRYANEMITELGSATVGTVGKMNVFPNGTNIVPARVEMGIDIRDVKLENMELLKKKVVEAINELEKIYGVKAEVILPIAHLPEPLSSEVVKVIEKSAKQLDIRFIRMNSGAGHDAQNMATKVKTGMIFVPSVKGISHAPMEWTEWDDIENGVNVLTQTLKNLSSI